LPEKPIRRRALGETPLMPRFGDAIADRWPADEGINGARIVGYANEERSTEKRRSRIDYHLVAVLQAGGHSQ
jgi:hypothetical protein